ncbi:hypothetical protein SASPL_154313 [Salvia splendens]|uniref:DOG1 domain-containing protein n=1 Tax=Salvia splendens TaxID=180675 RepID=A0A8X8VZY6_SALSN|nr:hypothetical protein SASPL_154313 [Salvia splendens]
MLQVKFSNGAAISTNGAIRIEKKPAQNLKIVSENNKDIIEGFIDSIKIVALKRKALKNDVFHVFTGMWKAPSERCFMWMGGFRPSAAIKIVLSQMEGLMEQQRAGLSGLHRSTNEAEAAITDGFERLDQCPTQTIVGNTFIMPPDVKTYMTQMSIATKQVSALQGVVTQDDVLEGDTCQLVKTPGRTDQKFVIQKRRYSRRKST